MSVCLSVCLAGAALRGGAAYARRLFRLIMTPGSSAATDTAA